ncbi:MAG: hypothetical protein LBK95_13075 [Bifidobacteriaceae bacterium]|jgi:hypothetical protein|nr:hypothetical protein [Bifidobacteriaceae bacterium]
MTSGGRDSGASRPAVRAGVPADGGLPTDGWPAVSIIVVATDVDYARRTVAELLAEPYPGEFEILLAAPSEPESAPGGRQADGEPGQADPLEELAADPHVAVVHAKSDAKAALINAAAFAARYPVLSQVRRGAGDWINLLKQAASAMEVTGADVVGGSSVAFGLGSSEQAISRALNSRIGVGPRPSRVGVGRGPVASVRMVAIRRDAFERVGGLNEAFAGAQDWELQHRVRRAGGMVWLDPSLALRGRSPSTSGELARTMFRIGAWRRRIITAHSDTSTWRYLMAPLLVVLLALAVVGGIAASLAGVGHAWWALTAPLAYGLAVAAGVAVASHDLRPGGKVRMWWAVIVIHLAWGLGFWFGGRGRRRGRRRDRPAGEPRAVAD